MQGNNLQSVTITKIGSNWAITNQTTDCILGKACWGAGQIYAGTYLGHQYFVTPGGCTNSTTPTCAGGTDTVTKVWGSAAPELNVMQNLTEAIDGADQSKILATLTTATAAQFCENMDYGGFQDWYLPARQEMLFIQRNSSTIGGFAEISGYYTSTEYSATTNWFVSFSQGYMYTGNKNTAGQFVRCVRRY